MNDTAPAHVEVSAPWGVEVTVLTGAEVTVGRADTNDLVIAWDRSVGRLHAAFKSYNGEWSIRDIGSRNGTFVQGEPVAGERALTSGDEIHLGHARLVYRNLAVAELSATSSGFAPPRLTEAETNVLIELCRPILVANGPARQPASVYDMHKALHVEQGTIKYHLANLYDKFGLVEKRRGRRLELANLAVLSRAVTLAHVTASDAPASRV